MKKQVKNFALVLVVSAFLVSCGKTANDYNYLVKEYKKVVCIGMDNSSSMSEKTKALQRQNELNVEYQEALESLSTKEQAKLIMAWSNAMAEVADGKCN